MLLLETNSFRANLLSEYQRHFLRWRHKLRIRLFSFGSARLFSVSQSELPGSESRPRPDQRIPLH